MHSDRPMEIFEIIDFGDGSFMIRESRQPPASELALEPKTSANKIRVGHRCDCTRCSECPYRPSLVPR